MIVYCDSLQFGNTLFPGRENQWQPVQTDALTAPLRLLAGRIFRTGELYRTEVDTAAGWKFMLAAEFAPESQFGILEEVGRDGIELPDGLLCIAGSGRNFKGFHNRRWESVPGNLHLTAFRTPMKALQRFHYAFMMLSAVSALEAIDFFPALNRKTQIKWVNDLVIGRAKVGGVLTHSQTQGAQVISTLLGIGINVQTAPKIHSDIFVPQTTSLSKYAQIQLNRLLAVLLNHLDHYYEDFLNGGYERLLDAYIQRSLVIGREVTVYSDPLHGQPMEIARGTVKSIGHDLELYITGLNNPVRSGRLVLNN